MSIMFGPSGGGGGGSGNVVGPNGATPGNIVLFDGATGHLIMDSGNYLGQFVPYTGATGDVTLGTHNLSGHQIVLNSFTETNTGTTMLTVFADTMTTTDTTMATFNAQNITASGGLTGQNIQLSGTASYATGLTINLGGIVCPATSAPTALTTNGGRNQIGFEWHSGAYNLGYGDGCNSLGGALWIDPGYSPSAGEFLFGNNLAVLGLFEDDFPIDAFGGLLGFTVVGFVTNILVAAGKTVNNVNAALGALSIPTAPFTDGGTVTNMQLFFAPGVVPAGGSIIIDNLYGFRSLNLLSAIGPVNVWGISIEDPLADNNFAKSISVGTADKKTANLSVGIELDATDRAVLLSRMTSTERDALTALNGMLIYNTTTDKFQGYENGAWADLI